MPKYSVCVFILHMYRTIDVTPIHIIKDNGMKKISNSPFPGMRKLFAFLTVALKTMTFTSFVVVLLQRFFISLTGLTLTTERRFYAKSKTILQIRSISFARLLSPELV